MLFKRNIICLGRSGILYHSGKKRIRMDSEFHSAPLGVVLYKEGTWRWESPYQKEEIDMTQRQAILQEIAEHFQNKGYVVDIR